MDASTLFALIAGLCGGLAFFLFGMNLMSGSLEKIAGGKLESTLRKLTSNPFKSLLLGAGITIAIQSSSAMTVMLVGLVNSGIMDLSQTIGVIMGSNIGTTLTAWILSTAGIESENFFIQLLKPESFAPIFALIGIVLYMVGKQGKKRDIGTILIGFAILMTGMDLMENAVSPLADMPGFSNLLTAFNNPLLGVLVGALFTGVIQSSAASVGILQALALTGSISYGMAIPIIMGQNIGTCVTALLSAIGVNRNAKRVSVVHMSFNLFGTVFCLIVFYAANAIFHFPFIHAPISSLAIACVHTIFNFATTLLLLPFSNQLVRLAKRIIPDGKGNQETVIIDERLMLSPSLAVAKCGERTAEMADLALSSMQDSMSLIMAYSPALYDRVERAETRLDELEDALGAFLVQLSSRPLTEADSSRVGELLHLISDLERIGDHAINIAETAKQLDATGRPFSDYAKTQLTTYFAALTEILTLSTQAFRDSDASQATNVEALEEVIDDLTVEIRNRHIHRLQTGACEPALAVPFTDLLTNCERVSDHCANIAICILQVKNPQVALHSYNSNLKTAPNADFTDEFSNYQEKYRLTT